MGAKITLRKIAPAPSNLADLREAARQHADAGTHRVAIAFRTYQLKIEKMIPVSTAVVQQQRWVPVVSHN